MAEENGKKKTTRKRRNYAAEFAKLTQYCKVNVEVISETAGEDPRSTRKDCRVQSGSESAGRAMSKPYRNPAGPALVDCRGTLVENRNNIIYDGALRAGVITHKCALAGSDHSVCQCECGFRWIKQFKGVRP